ncbi:MAG: hypothetical protein NW214_02535 [Pseudanabaenaceae cyanobacterium bins.39]|nr:hypothetical protein [Pseudanabaenaceae cyanobacterium bins.39]
MDNSEKHIGQDQRIENSSISGQNAQAGGDVSQVQVQKLVQIFVQSQRLNVDQFKRISDFNKRKNYIIVLLFLIGVLLVWIVLGLFARSAFPIDYVWAIILKTLEPIVIDSEGGYPHLLASIVDKGNKISDDLEKLKTFLILHEKDFSLSQAERLNQEDSRQWLVQNIIELLSKGNSGEEQLSISNNIQEIESQRELIREYLDPLIKEYYPNLAKTKRWISKIKFKPNQDQRIINSIVSQLFSTYVKSKKSAHPQLIKELLQTFNDQIITQKKGLSPTYTKILVQLFGILEWATTPENQANIQTNEFNGATIRSLKSSPKYHFEANCPHYPKREREGDENRFDEYSEFDLVENTGKTACAKCVQISVSKQK